MGTCQSEVHFTAHKATACTVRTTCKEYSVKSVKSETDSLKLKQQSDVINYSGNYSCYNGCAHEYCESLYHFPSTYECVERW